VPCGSRRAASRRAISIWRSRRRLRDAEKVEKAIKQAAGRTAGRRGPVRRLPRRGLPPDSRSLAYRSAAAGARSHAGDSRV
jgi:hypothetical protein